MRRRQLVVAGCLVAMSLRPGAARPQPAFRPAAALSVAQATPPASPAPTSTETWSREQREAFLLKARITASHGVRKGVTGTMRVTLSDGTVAHDASVQRIDERRPRFETPRGVEFNFRDTWRFNVAAYLLDKLLDLGMIPATVERVYRGESASFTWWIDDVMMDEADRLKAGVPPPDLRGWNDQMAVVRVFDQLIDNADRNLQNLLITSRWRMWMIDHSRAFRTDDRPRQPANLTRCDRRLLDRMRALDKATVQAALGRYLGEPELASLLHRRDAIVAQFDQAGEAALFDLRRPPF